MYSLVSSYMDVGAANTDSKWQKGRPLVASRCLSPLAMPQGEPAQADGAVIGYVFESKGFSRVDIDTNESDPAYSLAGQLMGLPLKPLQGFGVPAESYGLANKRLAWETIRRCPSRHDVARYRP